jgi:DNA invertase Pin-like site-specific DNA recombinase
MRLLVPIRVSRDVEEGSSPEDQRDVALCYQDTRPGVKILFTDVIDYDVSGATPIAERPGIKDWLQPDKINEWDAIGGTDMSRVSRDMRDYLNFFHDLVKQRGKIVVDLSDGTDSSTLRGRQTLENRILEAQHYREFVGEKRAQKAQRLADLGRWDGGRTPYGYRSVQRRITDDFGRSRTAWFLVKDVDGTAPVAERMVDDAFAGKSNLAIAADLNAEGVMTSIGRSWHDNAVRRVLSSPALAGLVVKMEGNLQTVRRDRNGQSIKFTDDPIISEERWRDLQDVLSSRSRHRGQPQARHMLWDVAFCGNCSQPCEDELPCAKHDVRLYGQRRVKHQEKGNHYWCKRCGFMIGLEFLERYVEWRLLRGAGRNPLMEPKVTRGSDHSAEIIKLERRIERLRMELDAEYDEDLERSIRKAAVRLDELMRGPHEPDRIELAPIDPPITVADYWASLQTSKDRNDYLRATITTFYVDRESVTGQLGWMDMANTDVRFTDLRRAMRSLKAVHVDSWAGVSERMPATA